mmetsp:Transcript_15309/g.41951  ORF Transcript_15309/g.41951 Transcript_15309/m.41951 type:complete len:594 (-) Transcript_15309:154-1935(-)|eukprot:CAMPEP_0117467368 /NCGR_PEP_ID=MMETSP0784-20121206/5620_1 /TAXON_ID=39447 /ORGANISM="" /LENGTH=593 /DNA_ID=CAMNT_0005261335 /DNA_START=42 /DNA_END=1823 /DNA_ORIENTATION=-
MLRAPWLKVLAVLARFAKAHLILPELFSEVLQRQHPNVSVLATELYGVWPKPSLEAAAADWDVLRMPRVQGPHNLCGKGPEQHYTGYLPAGPDAMYFFWLVRSSRSQAAGGATPLVLWLSGGPGCSSSLGMLFENGPCRPTGSGGAGWQMRRNPSSWTEAAHVVWVDQPTGVGFSVGSQIVRDEAGVAQNMYAFLESFFGQFPDLLEVPFFITGESYAGHYVPAVAVKVMNEARGAGLRIRLTGIAMGNALVSPLDQFRSQPEMARNGGGGSLGSGVVSNDAYEAMRAAEPQCAADIQADQKQSGLPTETSASLAALVACVMPLMRPVLATGRNPYDLRLKCSPDLQPMCYNLSSEIAFMNDPSVQRVIGVEPGTVWRPCSKSVAIPFFFSGDIFARFDQDVTALLAGGVRTLVYNGDCDFMVDWIGSKRWVKELNWPHRKQWASARDVPYVVGGRPRGLVRSAAGLTFLQVYDAGHLVPHDQPEVTLAALQKFLAEGSEWNVPHVPGDRCLLANCSVDTEVARGASASRGLRLGETDVWPAFGPSPLVGEVCAATLLVAFVAWSAFAFRGLWRRAQEPEGVGYVPLGCSGSA